MHRGIVVLLFCLLCHQQFLRLGVFAYYELNKAYIAKNLCENKSRPELNCCGKCYLNKQLKKVDESDKKGRDLSQILSKFKLSPYVAPEPLWLCVHNAVERPEWREQSRDFFPHWYSGIEHPPG